MDFKSILLAQKTGYIPQDPFDALFARRTGGAVLKDFPGLPASIVTVTDAVAKPLGSLKVAITPVQSGSGDPSPDNIRPISGWTECNITRTGKNLFNKDAYTVGNVTFKGASNNYITRSGIKLKLPNGVYTFKCFSETVYKYVYVYKNNGGNYVASYMLSTGENEWQTNVITVNAGDEVFIVRATAGDTLNLNMNLEIVTGNEEPTAYEPYTGTTYPITFPSEAGTVYGGTLDVTNGVLTVTDASVDLGTLNWRYATDAGLNVFYISSLSGAKNNGGLMCSKYVTGSPGKTSSQIIAIDKEIWWNSGGTGYVAATSLMIKDSSYTSASSFKTAMNGVQLVYKLATPITYQLTPTEVQMLLGTNNIWADTGDILEGKYWGKRS